MAGDGVDDDPGQPGKEALSKAPNFPDFNYHLALAYQRTNDKAQAAEYLQRVLKLDPNCAKSREVRKTYPRSPRAEANARKPRHLQKICNLDCNPLNTDRLYKSAISILKSVDPSSFVGQSSHFLTVH
jgi:hypothetical protein